ncbi:MAG TPA: hypothetical protein DEG44_01230, partial [Candidatus Kerfeldbacteria bacterium]|nr:hypothetical protein [Candidatus Kerfeldbacteria bacterium]
ATDEEGYKAEWSNWGKVDVMAPGVDIVSSIPGNLYDSMSGTSMASPHVAGVAALIMQKFSTTDARTVRHILQATADDFGLLSGRDYVSGSGMVNTLDATSTQTAGSYTFADSGFVITDASSDAVVTVSVRNASNAAVAGETVAWSTTQGTLSATSATTDANGEATVTFTADDISGVATITATPTNYTASSIQLALLSDVVYPESIGVSAYTEGEETTTGDDTEIFAVSDLSTNLFAAGDKLTIWAHPTAFDRETHDIAVSYAVTDPDGETVDSMTGTMPTTEAGMPIWIWYLPQITVESNPLKIPKTAADGEYTLTVTVTDTDTSESSSSTTNFWVGELPDVLILDDDGYCYDTPIEGLDFGYVAYCASAGQTVADALSDGGRDSLLWNITNHGYPSSADLALFPLVIVVDSTFSYTDTFTLTEYLDAGGNLLITSEQLAYNSTYGAAPTDFLWNYLHVNYASSVSQPGVVTGFAGSDFAGDSYNIDTYNIAGDGVQTMYIGDELQLDSTNDDVEALFSYSRGETDDKVAGVRVGNSDYRAVYLTFGLESVNDDGTATKATLIDELADWLLGDAPTISKVSDKRFNNNRARTIIIRGTNFQMTGETVVKFRKLELSDVVVQSRKKITATVPAGLTPRSYSVKVVRPDGRKVTKNKAVTITNGDIFIDSLSASFASNNSERELTITGGDFNKSAKVWFGNNRMSDVTWNGPTSLLVKIPAGFDPGNYTIKVKNPNGSRATRAGIIVRVGFTETLAVGDTHAQVEALEKRLSNYGYFTAEPDTSFDSDTEEALVLYQTDNFLQVTGKVDANTRYYLNNN